jgi:hypothetical protein
VDCILKSIFTIIHQTMVYSALTFNILVSLIEYLFYFLIKSNLYIIFILSLGMHIQNINITPTSLSQARNLPYLCTLHCYWVVHIFILFHLFVPFFYFFQ